MALSHEAQLHVSRQVRAKFSRIAVETDVSNDRGVEGGGRLRLYDYGKEKRDVVEYLRLLHLIMKK